MVVSLAISLAISLAVSMAVGLAASFFVEFSLRDLKFGNRLSINSAGCHRTVLDS